MSAEVFFQRSIFDEIRIATLPGGGFAVNCVQSRLVLLKRHLPGLLLLWSRARRQFQIALRLLHSQNHFVLLLRFQLAHLRPLQHRAIGIGVRLETARALQD